MTDILVPTSPGELVDKITILELKADKFSEPDKLMHVRHELALLRRIADGVLPDSEPMRRLKRELAGVNADLWAVEEDLRACEVNNDFGLGFIALARAVYITNDRRADIKKQINELLGSALIEEKSYINPRRTH